jgi:hypothetical protein
MSQRKAQNLTSYPRQYLIHHTQRTNLIALVCSMLYDTSSNLLKLRGKIFALAGDKISLGFVGGYYLTQQ